LKSELAFIRDLGGEQEAQIVIPESLLKPGATFQHPKLPFRVHVEDYGVNCKLHPLRPGVKTPALVSQGIGTGLLVERRAPVTEMDARNLPYACIELVQGERSLGTWLVTPWLALLEAGSQEFIAGSQKFRVELRFARYYQPFTVTLLKTSNETYRGTDIPKNFRSRVRVSDPRTQEAREVDIYMNHPLRYAGLTFYQARMGRDQEDLNRGTSGLQVVRNPGWLTPYAAVLMVAGGMYFQFRQHLVKFLSQRVQRDGAERKGGRSRWAGRWLEMGALGFLVLKFALKLFGYAS